MEIQEQTSIKGLFQGMVPDKMGVIQGEVIAAAPLQIQVVNDDKLVLSANLLCLPRHLTSYMASCDITGGAVSGQTASGGEPPHAHGLASCSIHGATITINNALRKAEAPMDISFAAEPKDGMTLAQIRAEAESALAIYLKELAMDTPEGQNIVVRIAAISSLLYSLPSLLDYATLTVNGASANIEMQTRQIAVLGEVSVSAIV